MKLKTLIVGIIASTVLYAFSCEKEKEKKVQQNTFEGIWYLEEMVFSDSIVKPINDRKDKGKYELIFMNDSIFRMDFTANQGGGRYKVLTSDSLKVLSYDYLTESCCDSEFDEALRQTIKNVSAYDSTSVHQLLLFSGSTSIRFER